MLNRDHASLLERHTHGTLKARGYFRIGEWFNVDALIAERIIGEVYDDLLQRRVIIEDQMTISESAVASEMLEQMCHQIPWRYSKRKNLVATAFGKKITVFRKSGTWHWVCDGKFSDRAYPSVEDAQLAAITQIDPTKDQMLDFILSRNDG